MLDERTAFAERLREAMREAGVSNTMLAQRCGVSVQAVGLWLKTGKVARDRVPQIAQILGISTDRLLQPISPQSAHDPSIAAEERPWPNEVLTLARKWHTLPEWARRAILRLAETDP